MERRGRLITSGIRMGVDSRDAESSGTAEMVLAGERNAQSQRYPLSVWELAKRRINAVAACLVVLVLSLFLPSTMDLSVGHLGFGGGHVQTASAVVSSEEARIVAEAWKLLDKAYVDASYNGMDWQATRQKFVKGKYKDMPAAYQGIRDMCQLLGDKYTRFLTPAQYKTITQLYQVRLPSPPKPAPLPRAVSRGAASRPQPAPWRGGPCSPFMFIIDTWDKRQASGDEFAGIGVEMTMDASNAIVRSSSTRARAPSARARAPQACSGAGAGS